MWQQIYCWLEENGMPPGARKEEKAPRSAKRNG
jgi:hypothetical protein